MCECVNLCVGVGVGVAPYPTFRLVWSSCCLCNAAKSSPQFVVINANMSCGLHCVLFVCHELGGQVDVAAAAAAAARNTYEHIHICIALYIFIYISVSVANKSNSKLPVLWVLMRPAGLFLTSSVGLVVET